MSTAYQAARPDANYMALQMAVPAATRRLASTRALGRSEQDAGSVVLMRRTDDALEGHHKNTGRRVPQRRSESYQEVAHWT